jgi:hypothetical protein
MTEEAAIQNLAETAVAGKSYKAQLEFLLQYIETAGLIIRDSGMVRLLRGEPEDKQPNPTDQTTPVQERQAQRQPTSLTQPFTGS